MRHGPVRLLLVSIVAGSVPPAVQAQEPLTEGHVPPGARAAPCDMCHLPHTAGRRPDYVLRSSDGGDELDSWLEVQAPGVGGATMTCLRCHWAQDVRVRQPDLRTAGTQSSRSGMATAAARGRYLGSDLSDDHPLGMVSARGPALSLPAWGEEIRRTPARDRVRMEGLVVECTTCHDPHDPHARAPQGTEQAAVCGACHTESTSVLGVHAVVSCTACHQLHGARQSALLHGFTVEESCTRCHGGASGAASAWYDEHTVGEPLLTVSPSHNTGSRCSDCHIIHR